MEKYEIRFFLGERLLKSLRASVLAIIYFQAFQEIEATYKGFHLDSIAHDEEYFPEGRIICGRSVCKGGQKWNKI